MIQIQKKSKSDYLSSNIESFCDESLPFQEDIDEQEKLFNYILQCLHFIQSKCIDKIKSINYKKQTEPSKNMRVTNWKFLENMQNAKDHTEPWQLIKFGSAAWNTSCRESDVDVAIRLNFKNKISDKKFLLNELRHVISECDHHGALLVNSLLNAKYPIIRVRHTRLANIQFDISIADRFCLKRNHVISEFIEYYEREYGIPMRKLIVFIKHWSKKRGINNAYKCYLNSFGFTLLIIQFIQCLIADEKKNYFNQRIAYFVYEFFAFYAFKFDPSKHCISICKERLTKKQNSNCFLEVIDPVNFENNVAQNVGLWQWSKIRQECQRCVGIYKFANTKEWKMAMFEVIIQSDDESSMSASDSNSNLSETGKVSLDSGYSSNDSSVKTAAI